MRLRLGLAFALSLAAGCFAATEPFYFTNPRGPHAVGLRVVLQYDYSRTYRGLVDVVGHPYTGERARPIQTLIWYPASKSQDSAMRLGDYLRLFATEEDFQPSPSVATALVTANRRVFDAPDAPAMQAIKDAPPLPGRYPVVIYAPSFSAPAFENAVLCEFLASHGYVVIASPDMGAHTRGMTSDLAGVESQAQDISFLVGYAQRLAEADTSNIAVAGFSWGGISNLFAAARDNRVKALVSFDGSARYFPKLIADSKYVHPDEMTLPVLFFTQHDMPLETVDRYKLDVSGNVLNQMIHSDVTIVRMQAMEHQHFASLFNQSPKMWVANGKGDYSSREISDSYGWVAKYVVNFLNATLKQDTTSSAFLANSPAKNGVPNHLMIVDHRPAQQAPVTFQTLVTEVGSQGFANAIPIYAGLQKKSKDFKVEETRMNGWAYDLISHGYTAEAIEILKLNVSLYPDSWKVYDSLAQACQAAGQKELAIANFKLSLKMNPNNENAVTQLRALNVP